MAITSGHSKIARVRLPEGPRPTGGVRRPSAVGYWIGGLIALAGLVAGFTWGLTAYGDLQDEVDQFARVAAPGEAIVGIEDLGGKVVYYEGLGARSLSDLDVRITAPDGTVIAVDPYDADLRYDAPNDTVGRAIGTFEASATGRYAVTVAGTAPRGAQVAVGDSVAGSNLGSILGAVLLVLVAGAAGLVIAIFTGVRRSRR